MEYLYLWKKGDCRVDLGILEVALVAYVSHGLGGILIPSSSSFPHPPIRLYNSTNIQQPASSVDGMVNFKSWQVKEINDIPYYR